MTTDYGNEDEGRHQKMIRLDINDIPSEHPGTEMVTEVPSIHIKNSKTSI